MSIRLKIFLVLIAVLGVLSLVYIGLSNTIILPGFEKLQNEFALEDHNRCISEIHNEIDYINDFNADWAMWDDVYEFILHNHQDFIESNLDGIFRSTKMNLIYFVDLKGQVIWGGSYDFETRKTVSIEEFQPESLPQTFDVLVGNNNESIVKGIYLTSYCPVLISKQPILKTNGEGPVVGFLIMGRFLNEQIITDICEHANTSFNIKILDRSEISNQELNIINKLKQGQDKVTHHIGEQESRIYSFLTDIENSSLLFLSVDVSHEVLQRGKATINTAIILIFLALVSIFYSVFIFIDSMIFQRLETIKNDINKVHNFKDLSLRTEVIGSDEIGFLGQSYNSMLDSLKEVEDQLQHANKIKSMFLANMSHEIRTPMNAIIGFGDLLMDEDLTDVQRDYTSAIRDAGQNLLTIINDILDLSKIESGKMNMEIINCNLGNIIRYVDSVMRPLASKKDIKFEVLQCSELPAVIKTDSTRLCQCLTNLVSNAIKFTDKGHVYVNVSMKQESDETSIYFEVEDTGIGIPFERQKEIFDSFTQADCTTTRKFGGTGLGLTITKQMSEMLGGSLTVKSKPDKGSIFTLRIPAGVDVKNCEMLDQYEVACREHREYEKPASMHFEGKVLVAEDNPANQMLIKIILEKAGLDTVIVENGVDAVEEVVENDYDLVFMDMQMPDMNGFEATKEIRTMGIDIPIIAITANALKGDDKKCIQFGCSAYISKPVKKSKLNFILEKYLKVKVNS